MGPFSATCNGQVRLPKNMVKMGAKARGKLTPHPPSAFHLPAPPPPAVDKVPSSWPQAAVPQIAPPEAQGAREAWPRAAPLRPPRGRSRPSSATGDRWLPARLSGYEWPSPSSGLPLNPEAIRPRATGPQWLWAGRARDPFHTPPPNAEACGRPGHRRAGKPRHTCQATSLVTMYMLVVKACSALQAPRSL